MKNSVRILRDNASEVVTLARKITSKHVADGESSVLKLLNWDAVSLQVAEVQKLQEEAAQYRMEMRRRYQLRDTKVKSIIEAIRNSRDVLTGLYKNEMRSLEQWGFDVLNPKVTAPKEDKEAAENPSQVRMVNTGQGMMSQMSYLFKNNFEIATRYATIIPSSELYNNSLYPSVNEKKTEAYEIGFTRYITEHRFKIQAGVIYTKLTDQTTDTFHSDFWTTALQVEIGM